MAKIAKIIKTKQFKQVMIVYILFNLGILFVLFGSVLYSPSLIPDAEEVTPSGVRMEILNLTKGALIAQNFDLSQYNIGYDMINIGGIFLIIGVLYYNNILASGPSGQINKPILKVYKLRKTGSLQGNVLEWLCLVVFSFSFFTFFHNVFLYIIIISFIIGVIGFTIRNSGDRYTNAGIYVDSDNNQISENIFINNPYSGIHLKFSSNNILPASNSIP